MRLRAWLASRRAALQLAHLHAGFSGPGGKAGGHAAGSQGHLLGHVGGSAAALNKPGQADLLFSSEQRNASDGTHVLAECVAAALGALLWRRHWRVVYGGVMKQ
jgi:hypothetical protein